MKFCKVTLFFALLAAVCLPLVAQTGLRAEIPFDFVAGGKSLPAGHYVIMPVTSTSSTTWRIYSTHTSVSVITFAANSTETTPRPSLVFLQAGGAYSLVQIRNGVNSGRDVLKQNVKKTLLAEGGKYVEIGAE